MTTSRLALCAMLTLLLSSAALGCGGSKDRFSGAVEMPDGFVTVQAPGATFVRPADWKVESRPVGQQGGMLVTAKAPGEVGAATPTAALTRTSDLKGSFDGSLGLRRDIAEKTGEDRSKTKREDVEVPGAQRAVLFSGQVSYGGKRYDSYDLAVLGKDGTGTFFSVELPVDGGATKILDSFRLGASA